MERYVVPSTYYEQVKTGSISCSDHLDCETRPYQKYILRRKLKNYIDGLVPSQRKVFYTALRKLGRSNKSTRVYATWQTSVVAPTRYHHGNASLEKATVRMGQKFIGSNTLPHFISLGNFGTRSLGRGVSAQSRYISLRLNKKLTDVLYPSIDFQLLPYTYEEGQKCEPEYLVPIIPMAIVDATKTPATGWKTENTGREIFSVIKAVRCMLTETRPFDMLGMPQISRDMDAYAMPNYKEVYKGDYSFDKETFKVIIHELPLQVWYSKYKSKITEMDYVGSISDRCGKDAGMA